MADDAPLLDKSRILGADDFQQDYLDVPEWHGRLRLRGLNGEERTWTNAILKEIQDGKGAGKSYSAALVICGVINEQGASLFSRGELGVLSRKSDAVLDRIAWRILELSGMTRESAVELEKN